MYVMESWEKEDIDRFVDEKKFPNGFKPNAVAVGHAGHRDLEFKSKIRETPDVAWLNYLNVWTYPDPEWQRPYGDPWLEFVDQFLGTQKRAYFLVPTPSGKRVVCYGNRPIINWGALTVEDMHWTVIPTCLAIFRQRVEWGRGGFFLDQFMFQPEPWWDSMGHWEPTQKEIDLYLQNRGLLWRELSASGLVLLNTSSTVGGTSPPMYLEDCGGRISWAQAEMLARQPGVRVISVKAGEPHADVPRAIILASDTNQFVAFTCGDGPESKRALKIAYEKAYYCLAPELG